MTSLPRLIRWIEEERVIHVVGSVIETREHRPHIARLHRKSERICEAIAKRLRQLQGIVSDVSLNSKTQ